jgi:hypothetical protein
MLNHHNTGFNIIIQFSTGNHVLFLCKEYFKKKNNDNLPERPNEYKPKKCYTASLRENIYCRH